jgi:hypothetical protein
VILAGVHDIKSLKLKLIKEGFHHTDEEPGRLLNSPWNIAADFNVDMSFNPEEIATMLADYENDNSTGMNITEISEEIYKYTSGYPFLVSRICQFIEERLEQDWTIYGVQEAVKILTSETNTLFDELFKNLRNNREIYDFMYSMLVLGIKPKYNQYDPVIEWSKMFGFIQISKRNEISIANKIFETMLVTYFISAESRQIKDESCNSTRNQITKGGIFNMELCLQKFSEFYNLVYTEKDAPALERHGRLIFLSYLQPLVNGDGFWHIESQFTDSRRMDVVLDYGKTQYIIELKLWRGEAAQEDAYEQILGYMETKNADKGYILTFDLRKKENREPKAEWVTVGGKQIFDVVV